MVTSDIVLKNTAELFVEYEGETVKIRALAKEDIGTVSKLLAYRHKQERKQFKSLNAIFEEHETLEPIAVKMFDEKLMISVGAFDGDRLLGFIISTVKADTVFGRCAWVKYDGLALAEGVEHGLYRELYAAIADKWIQAGCLKHFVIVPAGQDGVISAWLNSGFAYEQVFGLKELSPSTVEPLEGVTVRKALSDDKNALASISGNILSFQAQSPTYAAALPEMFAELADGYAGLADDEESHVLLAYRDNELLGFTCGYFEGENNFNMMIPPKSTELGVAATNSVSQNKGVGTLLTQSLFNDAIDAGYENSTTDWRITNLKSSVFWPKMGYRPYAYRMVRTIDERILWADGHRKL